jgi:hypothetical protein
MTRLCVCVCLKVVHGFAHVQSSRVMANPLDDVEDRDRPLHAVFDRCVHAHAHAHAHAHDHANVRGGSTCIVIK